MAIRWTYADDTPNCPWANKISSHCSCETCPFKDCLLYLQNGLRDTMLISSLIKQAYQYYDAEKTPSEISKILNMDVTRIKYWIRARATLEENINKFGLKEEYKIEPATTRNTYATSRC